MILSVSRRTDIPCWYAEWFMNRIRAGFVLTRNPMNRKLYKIELSPDTVDCIVFWTKDAENMLPHIGELDKRGYRYYFQFTLTPYGRDMEPGLREKAKIEETFIRLSERIGKTGVVWRYDPIIVNERYGADFHRAEFPRMCEKLAPYTDTVTVSFVDTYPKLKPGAVCPVERGTVYELSEYIGRTAADFGLRAAACSEDPELGKFGIESSPCIDPERIGLICGEEAELRPDKNRRPGCKCAESVDIGAYNTCPNGCVYCYANAGTESAARNCFSQAPKSPVLGGKIGEDEVITDRKLKSNLVGQKRLF